MTHSFWRTVLCAAATTAVTVSSAFAVVSGVAVPETETRYDAVGLVVTVPGGGSTCGGFISGSCTLIGPDIVLMARHSVAGNGLPAAGGHTHRIRFRRGPSGGVTNAYTGDCSQPFQEIYIAEFYAVNDLNVDIVLGRLETRPVGITPVPAAPSFSARGGESITLAGWGYSGLCLQSGEAWALRTKSASLPTNPTWTSCCFVFNRASFDTSGCVSTADATRWAIANMHDSGAPILTNVTVNGQSQLSVVGIVQTQQTGQTVAAWNNAGGTPRLPLPITPVNCPGDFNHSGTLSVQDIFDYLGAYFTHAGGSDFNGDGAVTIQDMFDFIRVYFTGCP